MGETRVRSYKPFTFNLWPKGFKISARQPNHFINQWRKNYGNTLYSDPSVIRRYQILYPLGKNIFGKVYDLENKQRMSSHIRGDVGSIQL